MIGQSNLQEVEVSIGTFRFVSPQMLECAMCSCNNLTRLSCQLYPWGHTSGHYRIKTEKWFGDLPEAILECTECDQIELLLLLVVRRVIFWKCVHLLFLAEYRHIDITFRIQPEVLHQQVEVAHHICKVCIKLLILGQFAEATLAGVDVGQKCG